MLKAIGRLYLLYFGAMLAILPAMYYTGLDLFLSVSYLALLALERREQASYLSCWQQRLGVALMWQLPGFLLFFANALYLQQYWDWIWYAKFTLELWVLPVLPLISLLPAQPSWPTPPYYYALALAVPLQCGLYLIMQYSRGAAGAHQCR